MRFVSVLLSLTLTTSTVFATTPPPADPELWTALQNIRDRSQRVEFELIGGLAWSGVGIVASTAGLAMVGREMYLKVHGRPLPRHLRHNGAFLTAMLIYTATQLVYLMATRRPPGPLTVRGARDVVRSFGVETEYVLSVHDFIGRSLRAQYEAASADIELRDFVLRLDAWLSAGVQNQPPPRVPAAYAGRDLEPKIVANPFAESAR